MQFYGDITTLLGYMNCTYHTNCPYEYRLCLVGYIAFIIGSVSCDRR